MAPRPHTWSVHRDREAVMKIAMAAGGRGCRDREPARSVRDRDVSAVPARIISRGREAALASQRAARQVHFGFPLVNRLLKMFNKI
jgi:hypothetical protein